MIVRFDPEHVPLREFPALGTIVRAIDKPIFSPINNAMTATLTLDSAGRLVLPKAIREKMHLQAGSKLRADLVGEKLEGIQGARLIVVRI